MRRIPLFNKTFAGATRSHHAYSGIAVVPDLATEKGATSFPAATTVYPVEEGILGRDSMMPPSGISAQSVPDSSINTGGAGSFMTVTAFRAKG